MHKNHTFETRVAYFVMLGIPCSFFCDKKKGWDVTLSFGESNVLWDNLHFLGGQHLPYPWTLHITHDSLKGQFFSLLGFAEKLSATLTKFTQEHPKIAFWADYLGDHFSSARALCRVPQDQLTQHCSPRGGRRRGSSGTSSPAFGAAPAGWPPALAGRAPPSAVVEHRKCKSAACVRFPS